jgi:hypothetical protein
MFDRKIADARALLTAHFNAIYVTEETNQELTQTQKEEKAASAVNCFFAALRAAGGTTEETLALCSWEDIEKFGAPKLLAKQIAHTIWRKTSQEVTPEPKPILKPSKVAAMGITELVSHYDPRDIANPVGERLSKISKGKRCVVFNADGTLNIQATIALINELREGYSERETFTVNNLPVNVYRIGERTGAVADENPFYPGRKLRPNGDCDQTNRKWTGVSTTIRQLVWLGVKKTGEIKVEPLTIHMLMDIIERNDETKLRNLLPKASVMHSELASTGSLPSLKIYLNETEEKPKENNPFGNTHKTY